MACFGEPITTPLPLDRIITSNFSSLSTIISLVMGIDTVALVSPGEISNVIGVLSKSDSMINF